MSLRRLIVVVVLWSSVCCPQPGHAFLGGGDPPPKHRLMFRDMLAAQWNPLGIQNDLFLGYRRRLFNSKHMLFRDTFAGAMGIVRLNPAFARLGAGVEVQPLAALTLRATWEMRLYFGTFNLLQSWSSPYDDYDEQTVKDRGEQELNYLGKGHQVTLQAVLKAKWGPLIIINDFSMIYFHMYLHEGDRTFYVSLLDTMAPGRGWTLVNSAHLLFATHFRLLFGLRHTVVEAFYPDEWLNDGKGEGNPNTPNHRLGPMVAYAFRDQGKYFRKPMLVLILNWWIKNRYRTGRKVSQAVPYGAIALQFQGDFWTQ